MNPVEDIQRLQAAPSGAQPVDDRTPIADASGAVKSEVLAQVDLADLQQLCLEVLEGYANESKDPCQEVLKQFLARHTDEQAALANFERFVLIYSQEQVRENLLATLHGQRPDSDDNRLISIFVDRLIHYMVSRLEDVHARPFDNLRKEIEQCLQLPDGEARRSRRKELFEELKRMTREFELTTENDDCERGEPWVFDEDGKNRCYCPRFLDLTATIAGKKEYVRLWWMKDMIANLNLMEFQGRVQDTIAPADHERIRQETLVYGAKTANLREMTRTLPAMQKILEREYVQVSIPRFEGIPASVYDSWKSGQEIDAQLRTYHQWIGGKAVYVRSSAVYSEDNDNATGAGIYHSEEIPAEASFDEFKAAVIRVYESVDWPVALEYRRKIGVTHETMGITLQDSVDEYKGIGDDDSLFSDKRGRGFINTSRAYAPALMDVVTNDDIRPIFLKDKVERYLADRGNAEEADMYYYQIDIARKSLGHKMALLQDVACVGHVLEQTYGTPVQCEYVADGKVINIVQTRILPSAHRETAHVEFPPHVPLIVRDATGVMDEELEILSHDEENQDKKGLVIFTHSHFTSDVRPERYFPKEGAVMILAPSEKSGGHIETLCIEMGLVCIFNASSGPEREDQHSQQPEFNKGASTLGWGHNPNRLPNITGIGGHKKVRVVANGMEARVYAPTTK